MLSPREIILLNSIVEEIDKTMDSGAPDSEFTISGFYDLWLVRDILDDAIRASENQPELAITEGSD